MKAHDKVMIYQDPITQRKPEGKALLLKKIDDAGGMNVKNLERWKVCFEGEDGAVYERFIYTGEPIK